ncbi:hypothetical protein IMG5_135810 [Ichthyophthirius multifiliis]|uniref:Transmembrane protein n=1 Tax=Ichthyophthirius multifiliis TaxID=5932 RepID=G0QWW4_ICHMU|nr:hypothetical protein IMG5_135810 [Ichthyophthirius multifiliis]EGR30285.1 hypothetical protein IMG5_135810 [Ichthyophthirius multifiliis]|eukprot:XP_004031872.1 hypothetical protein IMG5_135810 [Ichthyophthirius multifiliis]
MIIFLFFTLIFCQEQQEDNNNQKNSFINTIIESLTIQNLNYFFNQYIYETLAVYFILLFIIMYFAGKKQNIILLNAWHNSVKNIFIQNFAHVGVGKQGEKALFFQDSPSSYKFYASGRESIQFCLVTLEFVKRQDIIWNWLLNFIWPEKDTITIDIPLYDQKEPICAAILRTKNLKTARENFQDLKYLTQKVFTDKLDDDVLSILAGDENMAKEIFDDQMLKSINQYQKWFSVIHITDQKAFSSSNSHIRVVLNFPSNNQEYQNFENIFQLIFNLADKVYSLKLKSKTKDDAIKERQLFDDLKNKEQLEKKQEELQQKKAEKLREERERISKLSLEEQQKYEEKESKRQQKRLMAKRTVKVM